MPLRMLAQSSNGRFFEAMEQHAKPRVTRAGAKPTGCKQPVGTVTASAPVWRGRVRVVDRLLTAAREWVYRESANAPAGS